MCLLTPTYILVCYLYTQKDSCFLEGWRMVTMLRQLSGGCVFSLSVYYDSKFHGHCIISGLGCSVATKNLPSLVQLHRNGTLLSCIIAATAQSEILIGFEVSLSDIF